MIHSRSEFEAKLGDLIRTLGKFIFARAGDTTLETARRHLKQVQQSLENKEPPDPKEAKAFVEATRTIRRQRLNYPDIEATTFDLEDYLEFNPACGFKAPKDEDEEEKAE